jgi:hypothetical protein
MNKVISSADHTVVNTNAGAANDANAEPAGPVPAVLLQLSDAQRKNLEEIRQLFGEQAYQRVKADPAEAVLMLRERQTGVAPS